MRAGKYSFKDFFVNRYVDQVVVPEIQRDYVWGQAQLEGFLSSLVVDFHSFSSSTIPDISGAFSEADPLLEKDFENFYRKRNYSANIGFIYAYSDEQYQGRYFLIDGQQRLTSIFLILMILASRTHGTETFKKNYCSSGKPKLDYRVRSATSSFLAKTVELLLDRSEAELTDQVWLLEHYTNDVSIDSMLRNINFIRTYLDDCEIDEAAFYGYLEEFTEFWYFDTNISEQGENLYIYLNARGEQVQYNENIKADLLSRLDNDHEKNKWGSDWEGWQDFFWKKRGSHGRGRNNTNADAGFNEFLNCICGLKLHLTDNTKFIKHYKKEDSTWKVPTVASIITLEDIDSYMRVLMFISKNKAEFSQEYSYSAWVNKLEELVWSLLNNSKTNWFIDNTSPQHFSTETRNMSFLWGSFHWIKSALDSDIDIHEIFRILRYFYLRFNNNIRAVKQVKESTQRLLKGEFIDQDEKSEEFIKEKWLAKIEYPIRNVFESLIWEIEDHPINLDGSDVGAKNITHLVDFDSQPTLQNLSDIKNAFYRCFPIEVRSYKALQSLLLHYGDYWRRHSPYYYVNYRFDEWKYIVRSEDGYFSACLKDLISHDTGVEEQLEAKRQIAPERQVTDLREQLLWYNYYLGEKMWAQGSYLAIGGGDEYPDPIFSERNIFRNTKGDYRGGRPTDLADLLDDEVIDSFKQEAV